MELFPFLAVGASHFQGCLPFSIFRTEQYFQDSVLIFPEILKVALKATEVFLQ
jgi:hypothetical protein